MKNPMAEFLEMFNGERERKIQEHQEKVLQSPPFLANEKHYNIVTQNFITALGSVALYSTRAKALYDDFLIIRSIDDLIQSSLGIHSLVMNGTHNMAKREIRYLIEMSVKYNVVDQENTGKSIVEKSRYLESDIPRSSIDVVERMKTPFASDVDKEFKNEIADLFYKSCAYVHPSREQLDAQLESYRKGNYIGFESAEQLEKLVKVVFKAYDIILVNVFMGFGESMSGDLFEQVFDDMPDFRLKKGKYMKRYSALFDYKRSRQASADLQSAEDS